MDNPVIEMIRKSPDQIVRLYALIGFAMHYANEIEDAMFWCFFASSEASWEGAVDKFYDKVKFSAKQDKTDAAVTAKVAGSEHMATWQELNRRIQELLGEGNSIRNLISHNPVTNTIYAVGDGNGSARSIIPVTFHMVHEVRQKRAMVERRRRPKTTIREAEMRAYCESLVSLFIDLNDFCSEALGCGPLHRHKYESYE